MQSSKIECGQPSAQTGAEEDRILGRIFDREKVGALKTTLKLEVSIAELQLDESFGEAEAIRHCN